MGRKRNDLPKLLQWRLECLGHSLIECLAGLLPGPWVFRMGEALGGLVWHLMPSRRKVVLKNLRIAYAGEKDLPELRRLAKASFRRTSANLISAAYTARLSPAKLGKVIQIENLELLEQALAKGKGVVLLLSHMGNWELLSRLVHLFPKGSKTGAFYRPLSNQLLNQRVLARRQADGTRMFSKLEPFHECTRFLREGGIVGILADQRAGEQGELVKFFGRLTRASPLPSLLSRRTKSETLALSLITQDCGKWKAIFLPVTKPPTTENCMIALEQAMKTNLTDVFWLQDRWRIYVHRNDTLHDWLGPSGLTGDKAHRLLLWLVDAPDSWSIPEGWIHPDVKYEVALATGQNLPAYLPSSTTIHYVPPDANLDLLEKIITSIDEAQTLPLDLIVTPKTSGLLSKACKRQAIANIPLS